MTIPWGRQLKTLLMHNAGLKLVAIVMAVVLFSLVRGSEDAQRSVFVEVVALLPPPTSKHVLISELPDQVKLTLRGSRSLLNSIERGDLEPIQIDIRDASRRYYYFDPAGFGVPAGVSVVQLAPATVPLTWAARVEKRLPVEPRLLGKPGEGLSVVRPVRVEPRSVLLRGADIAVNPMRVIGTEALSVTGLIPGQHQRWVALEPAPPHSQVVGGRLVRVRFEVTAHVSERTLEGLEIITEAPFKVRLRPKTVTVRLTGPTRLLQPLATGRVIPYVDLSNVHPSNRAIPAPVRVRGLPDGIDVLQVEPTEVLITAQGK